MNPQNDKSIVWWNNWRQRNYSWTGLAEKQQHGSNQTLQDYWREEEGRLIEGDGELWTRFHLPLHWSDGTDTGKADLIAQDEFAAEVRALLRRTGAVAELEGCVLPTLRLRPAHHIHAPHSWLEGIRATAGDELSNLLNFEDTFVQGEVRFRRTQCGKLLADRAVFAGNANFRSAELSELCSFEHADFCERAVFWGAKFAGDAKFKHATFRQMCTFSAAEIAESADFESSTSETITYFLGTRVEEKAAFANARFRSGNFSRAEFIDEADFEDVVFTGNAQFRSTVFHVDAHFKSTTYGKAAHFGGAHFKGNAFFTEANWSTSERLVFATSRFEGAATFSRAKWPSTPISGTFTDVTFPRYVEVWDENFSNFAVFDGADFQGRVNFSSRIFEKDQALSAAIRLCQNQAANETYKSVTIDAVVLDLRRLLKLHKKYIAKHDRRLIALENVFRALKTSAEAKRHRTHEQLFYRYELICRRRRLGMPPWEKWIARLYDWCSQCGTSALRPMATLILVITVNGLGYWLWNSAINQVPWETDVANALEQDYWEAVALSARFVFQPLSVWSNQALEAEWAREFVKDHGALHALLVRFVATVEALCGASLLFLSALAVRRSYQIN